MSGTTLLDHFSALADPQAGKVIYPLPEILLTVLCGTMAGVEDLFEIERWATRKLSFLRRFLPCSCPTLVERWSGCRLGGRRASPVRSGQVSGSRAPSADAWGCRSLR